MHHSWHAILLSRMSLCNTSSQAPPCVRVAPRRHSVRHSGSQCNSTQTCTPHLHRHSCTPPLLLEALQRCLWHTTRASAIWPNDFRAGRSLTCQRARSPHSTGKPMTGAKPPSITLPNGDSAPRVLFASEVSSPSRIHHLRGFITAEASSPLITPEVNSTRPSQAHEVCV